jgi:hypothetical protein
MSGCIVKCPRCRRGHMRRLQNMQTGKNIQFNAIFDKSYSKHTPGFRVLGLICGRCGYVISR